MSYTTTIIIRITSICLTSILWWGFLTHFCVGNFWHFNSLTVLIASGMILSAMHGSFYLYHTELKHEGRLDQVKYWPEVDHSLESFELGLLIFCFGWIGILYDAISSFVNQCTELYDWVLGAEEF